MTTNTSHAKDLLILAERMGIPVDEAMRQVAELIADEEPAVAEPAVVEPVAASIALA